MSSRFRFGTRVMAVVLSLAIMGALLGGYTLWQISRVAQRTEGLYRHPLAVSNAVRDIRVEMMAMHRGMMDVAVTSDAVERAEYLAEAAAAEQRAEELFTKVEARFLGSRETVQRAHTAFRDWQTIRASVVEAMAAGDAPRALAITRNAGALHVARLLELTDAMTRFAAAKAEEFLLAARDHRSVAMWTTLALTILLFGFGLFFALYLSRSVTQPLRAMSLVATEISRGSYHRRTQVDRSDELGELSRAFDAMAASIEATVDGLQRRTEELQVSTLALSERGRTLEAVAGVAAAVGAAQTLEAVASKCLEALMSATESHVGAFYVVHEDDQVRLSLSRGVAPGRHLPEIVEFGEGAVGMAALSREPVVLRDVGPETSFVVQTLAGEHLPRTVVHFPVALHDQTQAVIALGSSLAYDGAIDEILGSTARQIAVAVANQKAHGRSERLAEELASSNEELQSQSEELLEQAEEMREQARQLERQRTRVESADRMKTEFLANMSHELRTPLNAVLSLTQLMLARGTGKDLAEERTFLEVVDRNGRQLLELLNGILDLSKIESGTVELRLSSINPVEQVEEAVRTVRPLAQEKGLDLRFDSPALPALATDCAKLHRILVNLLSNAIKFTDAGHVSVALEATATGLSIAVEDTGCGIPEKELNHVFDEFRQLDGSATRRYGGTGLGLAISRRLATLLGGRLTVRSVVGKGSRFTLDLPHHDLSVADAGPFDLLSPPSHSPNPVKGAGPATILVVDDNEAAIIQVRTALEESGHTVLVARGGQEAIESLSQSLPDGIVLDLMMPGIDGFGVLERLRSWPGADHVPVLVLTAKELTRDDLNRLATNNVHQLLQKGAIEREELVLAVLKMCGRTPLTSDAAGVPARAAGGGCVLLVEDSADNVLVVKSVLRGHAEVVVADDAETALAAVKARRPDLVLMDIQLPGMSGTELVQKMRADGDLATVPVVALTAHAMLGAREIFLSQGFDDYLAKPHDPAVLLALVQRHLQGRNG
jgi:signal transduction histidine kinase/DNA-binding response OmpR family regulator/HAMP domain-containing protein